MEARRPANQAVDARTADARLKRAKPRSRHLRSLTAQAACGGLVALAAFLVLPPHAEAQSVELVSNFGETATANISVGGSSNVKQAQKFTVPAGQDYRLDDVTIDVVSRGSDRIVMSIGNGSAADPPGTALYSLSGPNSGTGLKVYSPPPGTILEGGSDYFLVVERAQNTGESSAIGGSLDNGQSGETGWSIANARREQMSGGSWVDNTSSLQIRVRGRVYTPSKPSLSIADASAAENAGHLLFDVTLSRASRRTVKVDFETIAGGTATDGEDYHARRTYTHVILAGDKTAQMGFALINDTVDDAGETVNARLSNARVVDAYGEKVRDLDITRAEATGTITAPTTTTTNVSNLTIGIQDTTGDEDDGYLDFRVRLSRKYTDYVCYDFETISGGNATEGTDYLKIPKATYWMQIGKRVDKPFVRIIDDSVNDNGETVKVKISNARLCEDPSQTISITRAEATGTIRNSDPASGDNNWSEESAGAEITAVPALPLAGIGLLGLLLALFGSRAVLDDRRRLDASRGK